jgi:hypothetical protein
MLCERVRPRNSPCEIGFITYEVNSAIADTAAGGTGPQGITLAAMKRDTRIADGSVN